MIKRILLLSLGAIFGLNTFATNISGWEQASGKIAMGDFYNGSEQAYDGKPTFSPFIYATPDAGQLELGNVDLLMQLTQKNADGTDSKYLNRTQPVFVVYTIRGSGSIEELVDGFTNDTFLKQGISDLLTVLQQIEKDKSPNKKGAAATILLNPDMLGLLQQQQASPDVQNLITGKTVVNVDDTYNNLQQQFQLPTKHPNFTDNIQGYFDMLNFIMHIYSDKGIVSYGILANIWLGDPNGHTKYHTDRFNKVEITSLANKFVEFIEDLHVFTGNNVTDPDFMAFDKYGIDEFYDSSYENGTFQSVFTLYNAPEWSNVLDAIAIISKKLNNIPLMLWQMPGGHIAKDGTGSGLNAQYFFGDSDLTVAVLTGLNSHSLTTYTGWSGYQLTDPDDPDTYNYNVTAQWSKDPIVYFEKLGDYLLMPEEMDPNGKNISPYNWTTNNSTKLKQANVFAILWGADTATNVSGAVHDDGGWLYNKINTSALAKDIFVIGVNPSQSH